MPTVIPSKIQIETVAGYCNYTCIMCPIEESERKEVMDNEMFSNILRRLQPYQAEQQFLALCGLGETLVDKNVHEKIRISKEMSFRGVSVYTNGELLTREKTERLLDAGLDSLIVSIDGQTAPTQASIRVGANLDKVVSNTLRFLDMRNKGRYTARVIIRFTRQDLNQHEETDFVNFWKSKIDESKNDLISVYNVHNSGGNVLINIRAEAKSVEVRKALKCSELYDRLIIGSDGCLNFCCGDQLRHHHHIGSMLDTDPIELYNSAIFQEYRAVMDDGRILDLDLCKDCSIAYSIVSREIGR